MRPAGILWRDVTPLNAILGNHASVILVLAVVGIALLAGSAGMLDFMSGTSRILVPLFFERRRLTLFVFVGLPAAFVVMLAGGTLGALQSGVAEASSSTRFWLWLANSAFVIGVVVCGVCSPLARHWGLGLMGFAIGLGAIVPLLAVISALNFDEAGLLTSTADRCVFGVAVGLILTAAGGCAASTIAMIAYIIERTVLLLDSRHHTPLAPSTGELPAVTTQGGSSS